ncbi:putative HTH-type transcriptional regulator YulB [Bacillus sp. J14TS2]|uniref:DeoR/GlpR family DNA-binding transcription regulator n=1 Tax=Bacillus sp. J14TS2 TaxID=2807188 RepID=UPI001B084B16|nr:DeoR/GlpR family DNA-binding transcription regulator [Bacillus sp. J14TS2]GIN71782.1 putative HTH-type transcriptional regulator YulB [Bacillus sp. J14TS2]
MLVAERHEKIVETVNRNGSIRVSELSQIFKVTEETIRRDLEKLEKEGELRRSHGGAVSIKKDKGVEIPYFEREIQNTEEKNMVADIAIQYVKENDRIILDASTTAWYMAKRLPDMPLTVLTNSIKVAMELGRREKITVIGTGGRLLSKSLSYVGPLAMEAIESYRVDKAFISCKGIHKKRGISDTNEWQAQVKKKMIEVAEKVYVLADYSKFNVQAFSKIAQLKDIHTIITDEETKKNDIQEYREEGIEVISGNPI